MKALMNQLVIYTLLLSNKQNSVSSNAVGYELHRIK